MKLSNIIVAVGAASATFLAITNREKISKEVKEIQQLLTDIQTSKSNIQHQLAIIQSFQKPLQELNTLQNTPKNYRKLGKKF